VSATSHSKAICVIMRIHTPAAHYCEQNSTIIIDYRIWGMHGSAASSFPLGVADCAVLPRAAAAACALEQRVRPFRQPPSAKATSLEWRQKKLE
jgi:hypothetical protein